MLSWSLDHEKLGNYEDGGWYPLCAAIFLPSRPKPPYFWYH